MDEERDRSVGTDDLRSSDGSSSNSTTNDWRTSGGTEADGGSSGGSNVADYIAAAGSGTRIEDDDEENVPRYTAPPQLRVKQKRKYTRKAKVRSENFGITADKCESLLVGISGAISLAMTGTMELAIESNLVSESTPNKTEGQALGEALAECLGTIPDNPVTKAITLTSTWFAFGTLALGVVFKRFLMLQMKKFQQRQPEPTPTRTPPSEQPLGHNRFVNRDGTITAPMPQDFPIT